MAQIVGFVGIGLSGVVVLFSILAISLNYWQEGSLTVSSVKIDINSGLWKQCPSQGSCTDFNSDNLSDEDLSKYQAVRAMVMLGIFLSVGATVAGVLVMFVMKSMKILYFVAAGLDIAAGLFLMIGMAVYVDKIKVDDFDLHAAFALDVLAWLLAWGAGGVFVAAKFMDKE